MNCLQIICWMLYGLTRILHSNGYICLTWTLTGDSFKLKCLTSEVHAKVSFYNPFNQEQGYCYIPQPSPSCISYFTNSSISQELKAKKTVFEVRGNIGRNLNGNWSCHHGTNVETAFANVRIPRQIEYNTPVSVRLTGPTVIKTNDPVWFTCITNVPMITKLVRFYVNDKLYITLTKNGPDCYSSINNYTCTLNECQCSENGKTYLVQHQGFKSGGIFSIECKAEFEYVLEMSDCMMINVLDIDGPRIAENKEIPFLVSDDVELICFAFINNTDVRLIWDCLDFQPNSNFKNGTFINSILSFKVTSSMMNKICTCYAIFMNIKLTTSLTIKINKAPILLLISSVECTHSTDIQLFCNASAELPVINFRSWVHTYNGHVIRHIQGHTYENMSILSLGKCNYENEGEYICNACTKEESIQYCNNISSKVVIKGLPIVTEKTVYNLPSLTFSASIYAVPPPIEICWFIGNEKIQNSTGYVQTFTKTFIEKNLHGQAIKQIGFAVNLTVRSNAKIRKKIALIVQNDIGNVTEMFFVEDKVSFSAANLDLKDIIWVLSGTVILILIVTLTACVFKYHSRRGDRDIINMRTMYNVVETGHSNVNQYDMVEPIPNYVEINSIPSNHSTTLQHEYEEIDKEEEYAHEDEYEEAHEYTEVF